MRMRKQRWQVIKEKLSPRLGSSASVPGELFLLLTQPFAVIVTRTPIPPTSQTPASQSPQPSQNTSRPPDVYDPSTAPVVPLGQDWAKSVPKRHERGQYQAQLLAGPNGSEGRSRLSRTEEKLVDFFNGCICCTLREDLLKEVASLARTQRFDYLLVESPASPRPCRSPKPLRLPTNKAQAFRR